MTIKQTMQALIWQHYGAEQGLKLAQIATPKATANQLLVKVNCCTVCHNDARLQQLNLSPWLQQPLQLYFGNGQPQRSKILGQAIAGVVEAVGSEVTGYQLGDRILANLGIQQGAQAEYVCVDADALIAKLPDNVNYTQAAPLATAGAIAWQLVQQAQLNPQQSILIIGAASAIGSYAMQFARQLSDQITAVADSNQFEFIQQLGAKQCYDCQHNDHCLTSWSQKWQFDVILDISDEQVCYQYLNALKPGGKVILTNPDPSCLAHLWQAKQQLNFRLFSQPLSRFQFDFDSLLQLLAQGEVVTVIDQEYPFSQILEAYHYVTTKPSQANVIIDFKP